MFDHDRYVGPGSSPTFQFKMRKLRQIAKGLQICEATNVRDMWTRKETKNVMSTERRRNEINTKQKM